jgi:Cys-rich repeat protein
MQITAPAWRHVSLITFAVLLCAGCSDSSSGSTVACGDGTCGPFEDETSCPDDCQTGPACGDATCDDGEDATSCPEDCDEPTCGNGSCDDGEDAASCPEDCDEATCGNGTCDDDEDADSCPDDCEPEESECGDGVCDPDEDCLRDCAECLEDTECPEGQLCLANTCADGCRQDDDCAEGQVCDTDTNACADELDMCEPDALEPNDDIGQASDVGLGPVGELTICEVDEDFFLVTLSAGDRLTAQARLDNPDALTLAVLDEEGEVLLPGAQVDGGLDGVFVATVSGTYVIHVAALGNTAETNIGYTLDITVEDADELCIPDDSEPNDAPGDATPLPDEGLTARTACLGSPDFYTYEAVAGEQSRIALSFDHDEADLTLVATVAGLEVARSETDADREVLTLDHADGQTVVLQILTNATVGGSSYALSLARFAPTTCGRDALEPNSLDIPAEIAAGTYADLTVCREKRDFYTFDVGFGDGVTVDLSFVHANGDIDATLLGPGGERVQSAGVDDSEQLVSTASQPGRYTLEVRVLGNPDTTNTYNLSLTVDPGPEPPDCNDDNEPNNEADEATELGPDLEIADNTVCADDPDYFSFVTEAGTSVELTAGSAELSGSYDVALLHVDGETVLASGSSGRDGILLSAVAPEAGAYLVRITHTEFEAVRYGFSLVLTPTPPCEDDFEPNESADDATALGDVQLSGATACQDEVDVFEFNTPTPFTRVTLDAAFSDQFGEVQLEILDGDGTTVLETFYTPGPNQRAVYTFAQAGTYYARASLASGTNTPYTLQMTQEPVVDCADDLEPNNSTDEASELTLGSVDGLTLCRDEDQEDFFSFEVTETAPFAIGLAFEDDDGDIDIELLDTDGVTVLRASRGIDDFERVAAVLEPGTYFARVFVLTPGATTSYDITLSTLATDCEDDFEPNDNTNDAHDLDEGVQGDLTLCSDDDPEDFWAVVVEVESTIRVVARFEALFGNLDLELLDSDGETVLSESTGRGATETVLAQVDPGTYYVRAFLPLPGEAVGYTLTTTIAEPAGCVDEFEPNNSLNEASLVGPGEYLGLTLCRDGAEDEFDYFAVYLEAGDEITVDLAFLNALGDIDVQLRGTDGVAILDNSSGRGDSEQVTATVAGDGYYYLRVRLFTQNVQNSYDMTITAPDRTPPECANNDSEPNDLLGDATPLGDETAEGTICPADVDYYRFTVPAQQIVTAELAFDHAAGNLALELRDGFDNLIAQSDTSDTDDGTEFVAFRAPAEMVVLLRVSGAGFSSNTYSLRAVNLDELPVEDCQDALEPNNLLGGAATIALDEIYEELDICPGADEDDYFAVDVPADSVLDIRVTFSRDVGADLELRVLAPDGLTVLDEVDGFGDNEAIRLAVAEGGVHYIHVSYSDFRGERNTYTLIATTTDLVCEEDGREEDDSALAAPLLDPGQYAGQICPGDTDFVQFLATEGAFLGASLTFENADGNLGLRLLDQDGETLLAESDSTFNDVETIALVIPTDGLYFLEVFGAGNDFNSYDLEFSFADCEDEFEPNNNTDDAAVIDPGFYEELTLCRPDVDPDDFFAVGLTAGATITVRVEFVDALGDIDLYLLDIDGETELDSSRGVVDFEEVSFTVDADGTYFFRVELFTGSAQNGYDLTVTVED